MSASRWGVGATAVAAVALACAPRAVDRSAVEIQGAPPRPQLPTCLDVSGDAATFLLFDEGTAEAGVLARAMARGVAVVRLGCEGLTVLDRCVLAGEYAFMGRRPVRTEVTLVDEDEMRVNAPARHRLLGKAPVAITGSVVGAFTTLRPLARRHELVGDCAGASHFVRRVEVGRFAVGRVPPPPHACEKADPAAAAPLPGCTGALFGEMVPLDGDDDPFTAASARSVARPGCPPGRVRRAGKCTAPSPREGHLCELAAPDDCDRECERGDRDSCTRRAIHLYDDAQSDRAAVVGLYRDACERGDPTACTNLAWMHMTGDGTPADLAAAEALFTRACDAGVARACSNLAAMWNLVEGHAVDRRKSLAYAERSCRGGDGAGCSNVGALYAEGEATPRDDAVAMRYFEMACAAGTVAGCTNAGRALFHPDSNLPRDRDKARSLLELACERQDGEGCTWLAKLTLPEDERRAVTLAQHACALGDGDGCALAGDAHAGPGDDAVERRASYDAGCVHQSGVACAKLAGMHARGEGGPRSAPAAAEARLRALAALTRSCDLRSEDDCATLGRLRRGEEGFAKDLALAAAVLEGSCGRGGLLACTFLADLLARGEGVPKDAARAKALRERACAHGVGDGCGKKR